MIAKWFAWWNSLGLLGFVDYIREEGDLGVDLGGFFVENWY
jgi:hypothetical protein